MSHRRKTDYKGLHNRVTLIIHLICDRLPLKLQNNEISWQKIVAGKIGLHVWRKTLIFTCQKDFVTIFCDFYNWFDGLDSYAVLLFTGVGMLAQQ